ncbi:hypothetical protein ABPG75_006061 [Micractinium tetrahymenae]
MARLSESLTSEPPAWISVLEGLADGLGQANHAALAELRSLPSEVAARCQLLARLWNRLNWAISCAQELQALAALQTRWPLAVCYRLACAAALFFDALPALGQARLAACAASPREPIDVDSGCSRSLGALLAGMLASPDKLLGALRFVGRCAELLAQEPELLEVPNGVLVTLLNMLWSCATCACSGSGAAGSQSCTAALLAAHPQAGSGLLSLAGQLMHSQCTRLLQLHSRGHKALQRPPVADRQRRQKGPEADVEEEAARIGLWSLGASLLLAPGLVPAWQAQPADQPCRLQELLAASFASLRQLLGCPGAFHASGAATGQLGIFLSDAQEATSILSCVSSNGGSARHAGSGSSNGSRGSDGSARGSASCPSVSLWALALVGALSDALTGAVRAAWPLRQHPVCRCTTGRGQPVVKAEAAAAVAAASLENPQLVVELTLAGPQLSAALAAHAAPAMQQVQRGLGAAATGQLPGGVVSQAVVSFRIMLSTLAERLPAAAASQIGSLGGSTAPALEALVRSLAAGRDGLPITATLQLLGELGRAAAKMASLHCVSAAAAGLPHAAAGSGALSLGEQQHGELRSLLLLLRSAAKLATGFPPASKEAGEALRLLTTVATVVQHKSADLPTGTSAVPVKLRQQLAGTAHAAQLALSASGDGACSPGHASSDAGSTAGAGPTTHIKGEEQADTGSAAASNCEAPLHEAAAPHLARVAASAWLLAAVPPPLAADSRHWEAAAAGVAASLGRVLTAAQEGNTLHERSHLLASCFLATSELAKCSPGCAASACSPRCAAWLPLKPSSQPSLGGGSEKPCSQQASCNWQLLPLVSWPARRLRTQRHRPCCRRPQLSARRFSRQQRLHQPACPLRWAACQASCCACDLRSLGRSQAMRQCRPSPPTSGSACSRRLHPSRRRRQQQQMRLQAIQQRGNGRHQRQQPGGTATGVGSAGAACAGHAALRQPTVPQRGRCQRGLLDQQGMRRLPGGPLLQRGLQQGGLAAAQAVVRCAGGRGMMPAVAAAAPAEEQ